MKFIIIVMGIFLLILGIGWWVDRSELNKQKEEDRAELEAIIARNDSTANMQELLILRNNARVRQAEVKFDSLMTEVAIRDSLITHRHERLRRKKEHLDTVGVDGISHFFNVHFGHSADTTRND